MNAKISTNYGQCRCCLAKGNHRDVMKEYYWNGIREVYYDIFMESFNLFVTGKHTDLLIQSSYCCLYHEVYKEYRLHFVTPCQNISGNLTRSQKHNTLSGSCLGGFCKLSTDSNLTNLICTSCVQRLRDASSFRMMVTATERQLLSQVNGGDKRTVFVNVPAPELPDQNLNDVGIKTEEYASIKEENVDLDETHLSDYEPADELSDYETSRSSVDIVEGEIELLARFQANTLRLPTRQTLHATCPEYVRHLDTLKGIIVFPSMIAKLLEENQKISKLKSKKIFLTEKLAHISNASTILEFSNATPFRSKSRTGFPCFYCRNIFENLDKLKEHTLEHKKTDIKKVLSTYGAECLVVYVDVTGLQCTICNTDLPNLNELKSHLIKVHNKMFYTEYTDRAIPFKLSENHVYECQICGFNFETFGSIERHMNIHFRNYVCQECGTGFVTKYRLKVHVKSMHVGGNFPCDVCKKVFTTQQKHKNHVDTVHKMVKRFKCTKCPERFSEYFRRQKHMVELHGVAPLLYKCNVCDKTFDRRYTLSRHMKRDHLEERDFQCHLCSYKCFTNNELRVHMVKHNGERIFECCVCKKSYARKKTLKEHMRIHNNDRRFACGVCGQAFVQKCSLKGHLKTHHHEYSLQ